MGDGVPTRQLDLSQRTTKGGGGGNTDGGTSNGNANGDRAPSNTSSGLSEGSEKQKALRNVKLAALAKAREAKRKKREMEEGGNSAQETTTHNEHDNSDGGKSESTSGSNDIHTTTQGGGRGDDTSMGDSADSDVDDNDLHSQTSNVRKTKRKRGVGQDHGRPRKRIRRENDSRDQGGGEGDQKGGFLHSVAVKAGDMFHLFVVSGVVSLLCVLVGHGGKAALSLYERDADKGNSSEWLK